MVIAVASGKGGTGKTTVAVSLAQSLARAGSSSILLSDCDVEAPNAHLYLDFRVEESQTVNQLVPKVDPAKCTGCGICGEVCQFNAILMVGETPKIFPSLCHGCGSCALQCPEGAIEEIPYPIGQLEWGQVSPGLQLRKGTLKEGEPLAVPVISSLKNWYLSDQPDEEVIDSPPGASCPVVEAIRGADYVLLVTEPTPFGLHDLRQAVQVARELNIPAGVIINRTGLGQEDIHGYCDEAGVPVLMEIPLDRAIGEGLARGKTLLEIQPAYQERFIELWQDISHQGRRS